MYISTYIAYIYVYIHMHIYIYIYIFIHIPLLVLMNVMFTLYVRQGFLFIVWM